MVQRLGRSVAERRHRPAQIGQGFPDRNQTVLLTLHALFSHVPALIWEADCEPSFSRNRML